MSTEEKKKEKKEKKEKKNKKDNDKSEKEGKTDGKEKKERKDKKEKKGVTFLHERQTVAPPPRYAVGEEPLLPGFPITWTPLAICMETSIPGFSRDAVAEMVNATSRPGMSIALVHPIDLAEDEMAIEGTTLAIELKAAKEESKGDWPGAELLNKCLRSRSVLDRDEEHRQEELRRVREVVNAKKATEDAIATVVAAQEEVRAAENSLREYRAKLKEDKIKERTEKRLAYLAAKAAEVAAAVSEAAEAAESESSGKKKEKEKSKKDKKEVKKETNNEMVEEKENKIGTEGDRQEKQEKKAEKSKSKKGKGKEQEPQLEPVIVLTPKEQWKLLEDQIANAKQGVCAAEAQVEASLANEAKLQATLNEPFNAGCIYCLLGMDSGLPLAQLASSQNSFFRAVFNVALKPKVPLILPESSGPSTPTDDDALSVASTSSSSSKSNDSKKRRKSSRKEAKAAAKAAKREAAVLATPVLIAEIRAMKDGCSLTDPARKVGVLDVFYEPALPPELEMGEITEAEDINTVKKGNKREKEREKEREETVSEGDEREENLKKEKKSKEGKEKKEKKSKEKNKQNAEEKDPKEKPKKDKKSDEGREKKEEKSKGGKKFGGDSLLPYTQIAKAVVDACRRLLVQVQLYKEMGGETTRIFVVPIAKPLETVDMNHYTRLMNEIPPGMITISTIMHCLVEQVVAYEWPAEDIKALEVANENSRMSEVLDQAFKKLGHPKWIGVDRDANANLAQRFEKLYNFQLEDAQTKVNSSVDMDGNVGVPGALPNLEGTVETEPLATTKKSDGTPTKLDVSGGNKSVSKGVSPTKSVRAENMMTSGAKSTPGKYAGGPSVPPLSKEASDVLDHGDKHISATCGECCLHRSLEMGTCAIHKSHVDVDDEVIMRKPETPEPPYDAFAKPVEVEEHLNVTHEMDMIRRISLLSKPQKTQFVNHVDVVKVEEYMSKLRATPGRGRRKMPLKPEHSEEKMGASLSALEDLCENYVEPRLALGVEESIFHCAEHLASSPPEAKITVEAIQRYKKLTAFVDMIEEDKLVLPDLDIPVQEPTREPELEPVYEEVEPPDLTPDEMKGWCATCISIFSRHGMRANLRLRPEPSPEEIAKSKKSVYESIREKKKSVTLQMEESMSLGLGMTKSIGVIEDPPEFSADEDKLPDNSLNLEDLEHAESHLGSERTLDSELVKTWCPVCARIFAVPPPPDLQEIWEEGERMRLEMERLAREQAQSIINEKIATWKRREARLRKSIVGRRHAEGFADGLLGEIYARAKCHLPFEMMRYDQDEDCILTVLYAADGERTFEDEIPIYVPFGEFCAQYDVNSGQPIKKRREAYQLEDRFRFLKDRRRYILTEKGGLIVCGLPAMSPIQYEPRTTLYKDGNIFMIRAPPPRLSRNKNEKQQEKSVGDINTSMAKEVEDSVKLKKKKADDVFDVKVKPAKEKSESPADESTKSVNEEKKGEKFKKKKVSESTSPPSMDPVLPGGTKAIPTDANSDASTVYTSGDTSSEKQRIVMACLKDGLIACFCFAKDGTLSLQVNIPLGKTFEITSTGLVVFFPVETPKEKLPANTVTEGTPASPLTEDCTSSSPGDNKREAKDKKEKKGEALFEKENPAATGGGKEEKKKKKKKKKEEASSEENSQSANDEEKDPKPPKSKERSDEKLTNPIVSGGSSAVQVDSNGETLKKEDAGGQFSGNLKFLQDMNKKALGEIEVSRCILPSGSVICFKENGGVKILLNDGNVSDYQPVSGESPGWVTTNSKGFTVFKVEDKPSKDINEQPPPEDDGVQPEKSKKSKGEQDKEQVAEKDKGKKEKEKKEKQKGREKKEKVQNAGKEMLKVDVKAMDRKGVKEKAGNSGAKENEKSANRETNKEKRVDPRILTAGDNASPGSLPVGTTPSYVELPSKEVIDIFDPDTGSTISTREDLVVVVKTEDKSISVVQHADGTHIYNEVKEIIPVEPNPSVGQQMIEDVKIFNSNATLATFLPFSSRKDSKPLTEEKMQLPLANNGKLDGSLETSSKIYDAPWSSDPKTKSAPEDAVVRVRLVSETAPGLNLDPMDPCKSQDSAKSLLTTNKNDRPQILRSVQWHVRKEGFPHVHGNTTGGVAVEFSTIDGQYCATWSKESGQISLMMPDGSLLFSCGKLVYLDPSDGAKRSDPKQTIHTQLTKGLPFINTNGHYQFNLEKGSLCFTNNSGNGVLTSWGYKIDLISGGRLPELPPKVGFVSKGQGTTEFEELMSPNNDQIPNIASFNDQEIKPLSKVIPTMKDSKAASFKDGKKPSTRANNDETASKDNSMKAIMNANKDSMSTSKVPGFQTAIPVSSETKLLPSSPTSEAASFDAESLFNVTDPGPASCISTASRPASLCGNEGTEEDELLEFSLGPSPRLFVIHEGGFGFEIIDRNDFQKYAYSKKFNKECTRVKEDYDQVGVALHTFVTVEQKSKKLADIALQKKESFRAPDGLKLWSKKVSDFAERIRKRVVQSKMQQRTKCDWLQVDLDLPFLPRVIAPEKLPILPLNNVTNILFRQVFEYPAFEKEQFCKMDKILEIYTEWQEKAMILTDVEMMTDIRSAEEIKKANEIADRIREGVAEQKLQEARERAAIEVQHAALIFIEIRKRDKEDVEELERLKHCLKSEAEKDWLQFKELKKGPLPCRHKPDYLLQTKGPYRPSKGLRLQYFKCEEGLKFMSLLNFQRWPPPGPRRWSVEALPAVSPQTSVFDSSSKDGSNKDSPDAYEFPERQPPLPDAAPKITPEVCVMEEWLKEVPKVDEASLEVVEEGEKLCWEIRPPKKQVGPADWTPCFMVGFDMGSPCGVELVMAVVEERVPSASQLVDESPQEFQEVESEMETSATVCCDFDHDSRDQAQEPEEEPLPELAPFWQYPMTNDWKIDEEAVQRQLELLPNFPGWGQAEWFKNKEYLDREFDTMLQMRNSSVMSLRKRERPPKDWSHQFVLVPPYLDFGTIQYGTISMKVAFLQNYHGTNSGRFRFENLGSCCRIACEYGPVAPGLYRVLRVFFRPDSLGKFENEIKVLTQYDIFQFPIFANVVRPNSKSCAARGLM